MRPYYQDDRLTLYHGEVGVALAALAEGSIPCIVSSPPYNLGIAYADDVDDRLGWAAYSAFAETVARELYRVLMPGGRVWWNVAPTVPDPDAQAGERRPLGQLWLTALLTAGFRYRDTVIWVQDSHDGACAWGSWCQPSAPNQRGGYELVYSLFKGRWQRPIPPEWQGRPQPRHELGGDWGTDLCRNVWALRPVQKRQSQHPAAFPIELPARCIRLSTWPGETVLDPFCGTGATLQAAVALGRPAIGIDQSVTYLDLTRQRTITYSTDSDREVA